MGNNNHVVVSHKLCGFQGHVGGHICHDGSSCGCTKVPVFSSHIFSQASQNVTVKVGVDCSNYDLLKVIR
jgi:hypothetical protein